MTNMKNWELVPRRNARRGDQVWVVLKDGTSATGTLDGWGPQQLNFAPDEETKAAGRFTWKVNSVSNVALRAVMRRKAA